MKPPGTNAGSGSIPRLTPQSAGHRPRIPAFVGEGLVSRPSRLSAPNSNREPLRLEIVVTQTKQSIAVDSNREKIACFSSPKTGQIPFRLDPSHLNRPGPHPLKGEQKANRECFRLETAVTRTKQSIAIDSNREKTACFSAAKRAQITSRADQVYPNPSALTPPKGEQKANRECFRLETAVTQRKQRTEVSSNREKTACF